MLEDDVSDVSAIITSLKLSKKILSHDWEEWKSSQDEW